MVVPTSSSNRSKRKSTKPVTTDKGRSNRAKVSTAKPTSNDTRAANSGARVTNASQRASSGSAKVTGTSKPALPARSSASDLQRLQTASKTKPTRPAPRSMPQPKGKPALPPGQKGGALVSTGTRQSRAEAKAAKAAQGSTGPNRVGRSDARPALPQGRSGGALARTTGNGALARTTSSATSGAGRLLGGAGRLLGPAGIAAAMASEVKAMSDRNKTFSWNRPKVKDDPNGRSSRGVSTPKGRTVPTGSQQYNDYRNKQIADNRERLKGVGNPPASKPPKPPAPTQDRGGSTQDRGGNNAPRRQPGPAADAGMKNQDKNYKGSYVTKTKEETARMTAASMSRQQGRSNLTSEDLKPKQQEPKMKPQYEGNDEPGRLGQREVPSGVPKKDTKAQTKVAETLAERIRRRRLGM